MNKIETIAHIDNKGSIAFEDSASVFRWLSDNRDKDVFITIQLKHKKRSLNQNRYYWDIVVTMMQEAINEYGNEFDKDETHEFLKQEFNYKEVEISDGHFIKVPRSTTKLTTVEFMDYIAKIQCFASEMFHIYIPDPNQEIIIHS